MSWCGGFVVFSGKNRKKSYEKACKKHSKSKIEAQLLTSPFPVARGIIT
jgi:hypothetical protein